MAKLGEAAPIVDPLGRLLDLAAEAAQWLDVIRERVKVLQDVRYEAVGAGEQVRAEIVLYERAQDRLGKFLTDVARLGIEDRLARVSEVQTAAMFAGVTGALRELGVDYRDDQVRQLLRKHIDLASRGRSS
ncbi:hypothetical protein [Allobranchiibius sp. GilTou38]|uniref:hypothetical protein n=1 Tax=Allobranchiibius sp. GilTou38 TaxID=2815210 RepID=UPI001AA1A89F|nr:hypothetical protein [Allobranchiibius sp. GilTou38]MBO1767056.1 hypothetical protein [Allobranchiibius sp. GilTou38]